MEIIGTIERIYNQRGGISQSTGKPWESVNMLVKIEHQRNDGSSFTQYIDFDCMGDISSAVNQFRKVGDTVKVEFNIFAREWKDKWFNSLRPSKIEAVDEEHPQQPAEPEPQQDTDPFSNNSDDEPGLPF